MIDVGRGEAGLFLAEGINEIWNEIFFFGASFDDFFFVFDYDFVVGDFDYFLSRDSELGVNESFDSWAFDDELLDNKIFGCKSVIFDFAKFATFFRFDFETCEMEIKFEDFIDFDDIARSN